jgi:hypothetical protein
LSKLPATTSPTEGELENGKPVYQLELLEIFPNVYQPQYRVSFLENRHADIRIHFYEHHAPGRQVDPAEMTTETLVDKNKKTAFPNFLILKNERFSSTLSWYRKDLDCRVNLPWDYHAL